MGILPADLQTAIAQQNWTIVEKLGLAHLSRHPVDVPVLLAVAESVAAGGHFDQEHEYLSQALKADPRELTVLRRLGLCLAKQHRFDEALAIWNQVAELVPGDAEAATAQAKILAQLNRRKNGWEYFDREFVAFISQQQTKRMKETRSLNQPAAPQGEPDRAKIQQLELEIARIPSDAELYLQLANHYLACGREYEAERLLTKGKEATENEARVVHLLQEVTLRRLNSKVAAAEATLEHDESQAARDALAQARGERDRGEILIYSARCKREPQNKKLRYELAIRHMRAGKHEEAAKGFREVISDPAFNAVAALSLGKCREENDIPHALEYYRQAAHAAVEPADWPIRVEALFRAAQLTERLKLKQLTERYLAELLQIDPQHAEALEMLEGPSSKENRDAQILFSDGTIELD